MPQILNTGAGLYQTVKDSSYDPITAVKEAGDMMAKIVESKYKVRKENEAQFLKTMDKETGKFMFSTLQTEAVKRLKKAQEDSAEIYRLSSENPTIEDNIKIANIMRDFEGWRDERLATMKQYSESREAQNQDRGRVFDFDDWQSIHTALEKDPINGTMRRPGLRIPTIDEAMQDYYKKVGADNFSGDINTEYDETQVGDNIQTIRNKVQQRSGMSTEGDKERHWGQFLAETNTKIIGNAYWKSLNDDEKKLGYIKEYGQKDAWKGLLKDIYFKDKKTRIFGAPKIDFLDKVDVPSKKSTFNFGKGWISYGGNEMVFQTGVKSKQTGEIRDAFLLSNKAGKGLPFVMNGRVLDSNNKPIQITGNDILLASFWDKNRLEGELLQKSTEVDTEESDNIPVSKRKDKAYVESVAADYKTDEGLARGVILVDGEYKLTKAAVQTDVHLDLTNKNDRENAIRILVAKFKGQYTEEQINKMINDKIGEYSETKTTPTDNGTPTSTTPVNGTKKLTLKEQMEALKKKK